MLRFVKKRTETNGLSGAVGMNARFAMNVERTEERRKLQIG